MNHCRIEAAGIAAEIKADGAELCSLRDARGREFLWQAEPIWPRHAPVLFPIVGRLRDDSLLHDGLRHRLTQHGFARDRRFAWAHTAPDACTLRLEDDAETRASYPFPFRFTVEYAVADAALRIALRVENTGYVALPASMGLHPAFRWPLADGVAREAHMLTFQHPEPAPIRRVAGGLLTAEAEPSPIVNDTLPLRDSLFAADAVILPEPASRWVRYHAPGVEGLELAWEGFPQLGLWTKPGAGFLCIEPWRGYASPAEFDGPFADKPGLMHIPPGGQASATLRIRFIG